MENIFIGFATQLYRQVVGIPIVVLLLLLMVSQIYPSELKLNKTNTSDTKAAFLDLHFSISNDIVSTKIYDIRDDFDLKLSISYF